MALQVYAFHGAKIQGDGTSEIRIQGVKSLSAGCIQVPPDRIVSGTYICAAAITRSQIVLENPPEGELKAFLEVYRKMGGQYKGNSGKLLVNGKNVQSPVKTAGNECLSRISNRSAVSRNGSSFQP